MVVALSRSSCAPRLRGAPDAGEEVDESTADIIRVPKEWCAVYVRCAACMIERDLCGVR